MPCSATAPAASCAPLCDIILVARGQTPRLKSTQLSKTLGKLFAKAGLPDKAAPAPGPETAPQ